MGQSRRPTNRAAKAPLKISPRKRGHTDKLPLLLLTGFEPFGKERINPSWEIVRHLDGLVIGGFRIKSKRLPVAFSRAGRAMVSAIRRLRPAAVLALGQAGGRTAISVEHIAINLIDERSKDNSGRRAAKRTIVAGAPDAYFARIPVDEICDSLKRRRIPASRSLSAGAYMCNAVMYAALHELRRKTVPVGFIHLPYEARQASRHAERPSMSLELMERAIRIAIEHLG